MSSNPTNPEQVCPNDPSHKLSPGTLLCMTCGVPPVPVSKVAAKPKVRMGLDVESSNQLRPDPDKPQGLYASPYQPVKSPAPAPVDQPDELERQIRAIIGDEAYKYTEQPHHIAALIAREREAAAKEFADRLAKWVKYNKHDMGEMGEFIRTEYVYNGMKQALAALDTPAGEETANE